MQLSPRRLRPRLKILSEKSAMRAFAVAAGPVFPRGKNGPLPANVPHNYVAGEDTAVLEVIEGKKAWPRQKPPFPVTVGLFGKPTSINNVETLANVAPIIHRGAEWYRTFGTTEAPGTMIFSLNDDVN